MYISPYCRQVLVPPNFMKFGIRGQLTDIITCVKFLVDGSRGYGVLTPPKLPFPIDLLRRPYNSVALPCDTVISVIHLPAECRKRCLDHPLSCPLSYCRFFFSVFYVSVLLTLLVWRQEGNPGALPVTQPTVSKHWREITKYNIAKEKSDLAVYYWDLIKHTGDNVFQIHDIMLKLLFC